MVQKVPDSNPHCICQQLKNTINPFLSGKIMAANIEEQALPSMCCAQDMVDTSDTHCSCGYKATETFAFYHLHF